MRRVDIAELKAQLSTHLRHVREREEVLVCDRNKPVARITPYRPEDRASRENELTARGVLQPARKRRSSASWPQPPGNVSEDIASRLWNEERENR